MPRGTRRTAGWTADTGRRSAAPARRAAPARTPALAALVIAAVAAAAVALTTIATTDPALSQTRQIISPERGQQPVRQDAFTRDVIANLDIDYARRIVEDLTALGDATFPDGSHMGFRATGTPAMRATNNYIEAEMRRIGLADVVQEPIPVDAWTFRGAWLDVPSLGRLPAASFAGSPATGGPLAAEIVDVGDGTRQDYEGKDVAGKIVLANWNTDLQWVDTMAEEARVHGAAAIVVTTYDSFYGNAAGRLSCHDGLGFTRDFPPMISISGDDGLRIIALLESGAGPLVATAFSDISIQTIDEGGTGHNVVGYLPGRRYGRPDDQFVILGDHPDAWFFGAMDDSIGTAATLVLAEALKKAVDRHGPLDRTIIFATHDAEEYGILDAYYDWAYGAWYQITQEHPEWVGRTVAYLNFELMGQPGPFRADPSPEIFSWMQRALADNQRNLPYGKFLTKGVSVLADAWTFGAAGIPSATFVTYDARYFPDNYHTQGDTIDLIDFTYVRQLFSIFADMAVRLARAPIVPYNFETTAKDLSEAIHSDNDFYNVSRIRQVYGEYGWDPAPNLERMTAAAAGFQSNAAALAAALNGRRRIPPGLAMRISEEIMAIQAVLGPSLVAMDNFEATRFPYQQGGQDLVVLDRVIETLSGGDVPGDRITDALVDIRFWVGINWYADFLSRPAYDGVRRRHSLEKKSWGTQTKVQPTVELYDEYQQLRALARTGATAAQMSPILARIRAELHGRAFPNMETNLGIMWRGLEEANARLEALIGSL